MKRLLLLPAAAIAAGVQLYRSGYAWPILTTVIRPWLPRPGEEPDIVA